MIETFPVSLSSDFFGLSELPSWAGLCSAIPDGAGLWYLCRFSFFYSAQLALAILNIGVLVLTAHLFPAAARKTDWQIMTPMLVATVICAPIGSWFLFFSARNNPTDHWAHHYQFIGSNFVGMALPGPQGSAPAATGAIAGLISGLLVWVASMVIYLMAIDKSADVQRACILVGMAVVSVVIFTSQLLVSLLSKPFYVLLRRHPFNGLGDLGCLVVCAGARRNI